MTTPTSLLLRTPNAAHTTIQPPLSSSTNAGFETMALFAMNDGYAVRTDRVHATLQEGCALLTGNVQWQYQKDGATRCVQALDGVFSVNNLLTLQPDAPWFTGVGG